MAQTNSNLLSRPYDDFMPGDMLAKVIERRHSPDGMCHELKEISRAGRRVYDYPWPKMELGDFFLAPIGTRSEGSMRTAFHQAAARFDFEIAIKKVHGRINGEDRGTCLRVTICIIGVDKWKRHAQENGVTGIRFSDGKWKERRRRWEKDNRGSGRVVSRKSRKAKQEAAALANPFHADRDLPVETNPTFEGTAAYENPLHDYSNLPREFLPTKEMTPEERRARALRLAKAAEENPE